MLKHPSVRHNVGKAARILVKEDRQEKKKADVFQKIFGQKVCAQRKTMLGQFNNDHFSVDIVVEKVPIMDGILLYRSLLAVVVKLHDILL